MNIGRATLVVAASAVLLVGAVAAIRSTGGMQSASAQEPDGTPSAERQDRRGQFLDRVAEKLGITSDDLRGALQSAALDVVDEALTAGRITEEQAANARERIESGQGLGLFRRLHERREHRADLVRRQLGISAATALAITVEELRAELKSGASIADVAAERNIPLDDVTTQILTDAQAKLDDAVANGRITQERADAAFAKLTEKIDDILNKSKEPAPTP